MGVPLRVIRADFVGVADSHSLYVGFPQKMKHDAQTLGADADEAILTLSLAEHTLRHPTPGAERSKNQSPLRQPALRTCAAKPCALKSCETETDSSPFLPPPLTDSASLLGGHSHSG